MQLSFLRWASCLAAGLTNSPVSHPAQPQPRKDQLLPSIDLPLLHPILHCHYRLRHRQDNLLNAHLRVRRHRVALTCQCQASKTLLVDLRQTFAQSQSHRLTSRSEAITTLASRLISPLVNLPNVQSSPVSRKYFYCGTQCALTFVGKHDPTRDPAAITSLSAACRCASCLPSDPTVITP